MEASCSLQSELGDDLCDFLQLALLVRFIRRIVARVWPWA